MSIQNRQPKGIPVGGQFATSAKGESGIGLSEDHTDLQAEAAFETAIENEHPTVRWNGRDHMVLDDRDGNFTILVNNTYPVAFSVDDPTNDDLIEEAALMAADAHQNQMWGNVKNVGVGSRTPWGAADSASYPAPGIVSVGTPGHGGIKLSKERNATIPKALRNKDGWYEEDAESNIVGMYHPEAFPHRLKDRSLYEVGQECEKRVRSSFPDAYTEATGREVPVEESWVLRDRAKQQSKEEFRAAHSDQFVTLGNGNTGNSLDAWIPKGYAACEARLDDTGETRTFLLPHNEVITNHSFGQHALVDPKRHLDVTDVVNAQSDRPWTHARNEVAPLSGEAMGIDYSHLTAAQADRARSELNKVWRFSNGDGTFTTESLAEHMSRRGVVGKRPRVDGDKVEYWVDYPNSGTYKVSKAAYDALTGVPDTSTDTQKAYVAKERARVAFEREKVKFDISSKGAIRRMKVEEAYAAAGHEYKTLSDRDSEDARAWQAETTAVRQAAFDRIAAERGFDFGTGE